MIPIVCMYYSLEEIDFGSKKGEEKFSFLFQFVTNFRAGKR